MRTRADIAEFIAGQADMVHLLRVVERQMLPDCWVGAGFVRNAVWDALHGRAANRASADIDVVYFDAADVRVVRDAEIEAALTRMCPGQRWSVKNQARMHIRNGDAAYADTRDALRHWPERCTAVAARIHEQAIELLAPYGVCDLITLTVRPTPAFAAKLDVYRERLRQKEWHRTWPLLTILDA
jgi:hypothetical protein